MRNRFEARIVLAGPAEDAAEYDEGFRNGYVRGWDDMRSGVPYKNPEPASNESWGKKGDHQGYSEGYGGALTDSIKRGDINPLEQK